MARRNLVDALNSGIIILDGGTGTELFERDGRTGVCNDYLNIDRPELVAAVHSDYLKAGSDAVLTNTFGGNRFALERHGHSGQVSEINVAGAKVARDAAGDNNYVLGDIGPTGDFLEPLGPLKPKEVRQAFKEQARALVENDVDGLIIESMTALEEVRLAVEAAGEVAGELPIFASMAFQPAGEDFKTIMGVGVKAFLSEVLPLGVDAVGFNCGKMTLDSYVGLASLFAVQLKAMDSKIKLLAELNAGIPEIVDDKPVYSVTPQDFAAAITKIRDAGFTVLGGCCGTGPKHIKAVTRILRK